MFKAVLVVAISTLLLAPARAVLVYNEGTDANNADPGGGVPWDSVATVRSAGLSTGSAVYLGSRYMITANHVNVSSSPQVSFNGTDFLSIDSTFGVNGFVTIGTADLKVFRLTSDPSGVDPVLIYQDLGEHYDLNRESILIGWGRGRATTDTVPYDNPAPWGDNTTVAERWGQAITDNGTHPLTYGGYNYLALGTTLRAAADEGGAAYYDSGGGLFQYIGSEWYLVGITTIVETSGSTRFGESDPDSNYFVRTSLYRTAILAEVPEPGQWGLLAGCGLLAYGWLTRRARKG